ncbi:glucan endo-1,3-beta-glucosidase-like [Bidens hawaiensis]|uniref:glucan endo-1,3-beta-glucosidase-like n=1 Tax=Bidens hawaiensis TaxID=980011 RepID=UPI00404AD222
MNTVTPRFLTLIFFFFFISGGMLKIAKGQAPGQGAWCIAKPSTSDEELQNNIAYACTYINCKIIRPGGTCFEPQKLVNRASVVMNLYYQTYGRNYWNCDFKGSGIIAVTDPSYGDCKYSFKQ